jgi:curved DNA-binding protein CbpA
LFLRRKLRGVTDYFALLEQPRQPWIDLEKLEQKYYELARITHPDQSSKSRHHFAQVNEAYRTLRDPKLRLQHLLTLEGNPPSTSTAKVPPDLADLFMKIAPALANNDKKKIHALIEELSDSYEEGLEQLHRLNDSCSKHEQSGVNKAEDLYRRFAFLTRWRNLLQEHNFSNSFPNP